MEKLILACSLKDRRFYERIKAERPDFSRLSNEVFDKIGDFYDRDSAATHISKEALSELIQRASSGVSKKRIDALLFFLRGLEDSPSVPNISEALRQTRLSGLAGPVAIALANGEFDGLEGKLDELRSVLSENRAVSSAPESREVVRGFEPESGKQNGDVIKLWPKALNDACGGGCYRENHIIVYARPEIGKSLFALNLAAGFLRQDLVVLYVGNEDPAHSMRQRMLQRIIKKTRSEIDAAGGVKAVELLAKESGGDNFIFASLAPGTFGEISALTEEFKADVVVLDQLRNIEMDGESRTLDLDKAARCARNLAKSKNAVVVSLTQAGESAEGKIVLGRSDIDFSKTGIPGACDLMVGIGADAIMERNGERCIALPKNKLSGRHEHFFVKFDTSRGIVEEVQ